MTDLLSPIDSALDKSGEMLTHATNLITEFRNTLTANEGDDALNEATVYAVYSLAQSAFAMTKLLQQIERHLDPTTIDRLLRRHGH
jgi:hypothetical protein